MSYCRICEMFDNCPMGGSNCIIDNQYETILRMAKYIALTDCDEGICKKVKECYDEKDDRDDGKCCVECIVDFFSGSNAGGGE